MTNNENRPPMSPPISRLSPSNKPALSLQRDHSACGRPETPLRVRKTRENLKQSGIFVNIPPPCMHGLHNTGSCGVGDAFGSGTTSVSHVSDTVVNIESNRRKHSGEMDDSQSTLIEKETTPPGSQLHRQKSVRRRMLDKVRQGITSRTKSSQPFSSTDSETKLERKSSRNKGSASDQRRRTFEACRESIDSSIDESFESLEAVASVGRSFTGSTSSTTDLLASASTPPGTPTQTNYSGLTAAGGTERTCNSLKPSPPLPSSHVTPRPRCENLAPSSQQSPSHAHLPIPHVALDVALDCTTLDAHATLDTWIAIKATVLAHDSTWSNLKGALTPAKSANIAFTRSDERNTMNIDGTMGNSIPSLRICFEAVNGCRVRYVIGNKTGRNLMVGQECSLFIKLHIPKVGAKKETVQLNQGRLLAEIESIVGTLETEVLHVEARYRHPMLPYDNIVTVRHSCKFKRPTIKSRWSMIDDGDATTSPLIAQVRLADYLKAHFPPEQALNLINEHIEVKAADHAKMSPAREGLTDLTLQPSGNSVEEDTPSVVVTDIDHSASPLDLDSVEQVSTAPSTPAEYSPQPARGRPNMLEKDRSSPMALLTSTILAPSLISAPQTTTALFTAHPYSRKPSDSLNTGQPLEPQDTARQLWRHIRHSSLSARQLEDIAPERLEHLEASDDDLKELRRKALANKRSVGAETLMGWKWEEKVSQHQTSGEAPWM